MSPNREGLQDKPYVPLSRREFLYYTWGFSIAVFMAGTGGALIWFALPRFREGEFGGVFAIPVDEVPGPDAIPKEYPEGRYWLVNIGPGIIADPRQPDDYRVQPGIRALYKVCTHLGCLYKWAPTNDRFECPCHGSKFLKTGARIDGPARRNLDVFMVEALNEADEVLARTEPSLNSREGAPINLPEGTVRLRIDTGRRILGGQNTKPGGGL
ncbi:MAG: Rieske 2Fe-2S domain-containing protein [Anaerolineales bacterium]|nr:Rieske 2Fe-2S domain-containing protein [Anaerolineales bacterium]